MAGLSALRDHRRTSPEPNCTWRPPRQGSQLLGSQPAMGSTARCCCERGLNYPASHRAGQLYVLQYLTGPPAADTEDAEGESKDVSYDYLLNMAIYSLTMEKVSA